MNTDRWCRRAVRRSFRFYAVGALGIVVQLSALWFLSSVLGWSCLAATAAAVECAVLHNFGWHERWTWGDRAGGSSAALAQRLVKFHVANGAVSIIGNMVLTPFVAGALGIRLLNANLIAILVCSIANFLAGDRLVFRAATVRERVPACSRARL